MFVNTEYFSPVAKKGVTTAPPKSYEYIQWWNEQHKRCTNGYTVGGVRITGLHYFYLNFWKIRGSEKPGERKKIMFPRFLDIDYEFFHEVEQARKDGQHMCVAKKRQCGFTEKSACLVGYEFTFFPGSQSVIVAGEEKYAHKLRNDCLRGLNDLMNTEFRKKRIPLSGDYVQAKRLVKGAYKGSLSEIHTLTAKNNTEVVSRLSPSLIVYEECGKFPRVRDVHGFVAPSLESEGLATGFALFIGTGGDMDEGLDQFAELFYKPDKYNIRSYPNIYESTMEADKIAYFVPGWKYYIVDKDGNSLEKESKEKIDANRTKLADKTNMKLLIDEVIARPGNPDEVFNIVKKGRFNQAKLNLQQARIRKTKNSDAIGQRITIKWRYDGIPKPNLPHGSITGVEWEYNDEGEFLMFFEPELDSFGNPKENICFGGTDSYDKDDALSSSSELSTSIFNGRHKRFEARYTGRPDKAEDAWEKSFMLCVMYGARNLIEWSNIGIFGWAERMGLLRWVKERPRVAYADVINSKVNNQYGVDPNTRSFWISSYADYIEDHYENMWDLWQINRALRFKEKTDTGKKYNCDVTISSSLAYVHYLDEIEYIPSPDKVSTEERIEFVYFTAVNGVIQNKIYK